MTFEENPFRVLGVSIYDTKSTIIERADDLSFADPDREKIFNQARDILINPRKRIAAEFWELIGDKIICDVNRFADILTINKKFSELDAEKIMANVSWKVYRFCEQTYNISKKFWRYCRRFFRQLPPADESVL